MEELNVGDDSKYTIADAFASYLATNSKKKTASSQKIDIRVLKISQHFFEKELGLVLMSEVSLESLERFELWAGDPQKCGDITKGAWSGSSVLRHGKTLKTIFRKAFLTGRIQRDPTALWKLQGSESATRRLMTDDEFDTILSIAPEWFKPVLRVLALTGQRPSGVARLKWSDVDFVNGELYFTSRKGGAKREKRNAFPIFPELKDILIGATTICRVSEVNPADGTIKVEREFDPANFVFLKDGQPISGPLISTTAHRLIKQAGFKNVVLYSLRHKFITDLIKSGAPNEVTRRLAGHANESMIKVYSKNLGMESLENAVSSIRGKK